MTIVTKPITEKKSEKPLEKPLVCNEALGGDCNDHAVIDPNTDDVEAWLSSSARRRVSTATTICVFLTALLVMSIGIIGGVYLYRQFSQHQMNRFRGWCGIPYERNLMERSNLELPANYPLFTKKHPAEWSTGALFKEEFDLDLDEEAYEQIHVPSFEFGRRGRFIHDFKTNKTAIIDYTSGRCFVMSLDRRHVLPPRTVFDLVKKMWMGYYNIDTGLVRQTMRVTYPAVSDYEPFGKYISDQCSNYPTYVLVAIQSPGVKKRSVDDQVTDEAMEFVEFAGNKIVLFTILEPEPEALQQQ
ncbi:integral membrane protein 2C [Palaemon carinicauda]|uniref:integral membrane protein 2C n=1 Tax=Palaemon carinicauda TaxID=392227 RepID=UPI0035B6166D